MATTIAQFLTLIADNDFAARVRLQEVESPTGALVDVTSGTVTGFLSVTDDLETAAKAHPDFTVSYTWTGEDGWWLATIDKALLNPATLRATFENPECYLFAIKSGDFKASVKCKIKYTNPMVVTA